MPSEYGRTISLASNISTTLSRSRAQLPVLYKLPALVPVKSAVMYSLSFPNMVLRWLLVETLLAFSTPLFVSDRVS